MIKTYRRLRTIRTFYERYQYLKLSGQVGVSTFGYDRYLNQMLYASDRWLKTRDLVVIRDEGNDLGLDGFPINGRIIVHHINPITVEDIENDDDSLYDLNNLISTSKQTHDAIHFGNEDLLPKDPIERRKNDTCPWRV